MKDIFRYLMLAIGLFFILCSCICLGGFIFGDTSQLEIQEQKEFGEVLNTLIPDETPYKESKKETPTKEAKKIELKIYEFGNGNYVAGKDFISGIYDIVAIEGNGNVSSSNLYDGGINAIMGIKGGMYEKEYKNIEFPENTKIKIDGVKVKLIQKER